MRLSMTIASSPFPTVVHPAALDPVTLGHALHRLRLPAGLVFQDPDDQLFCPTVAEDIAFGPLNLGKAETEVLDLVARRLKVSERGADLARSSGQVDERRPSRPPWPDQADHLPRRHLQPNIPKSETPGAVAPGLGFDPGHAAGRIRRRGREARRLMQSHPRDAIGWPNGFKQRLGACRA